MANLTVYKANELVVSRYDLTEQETRVILFGISKLNPMLKNPTKEDRTVKISCEEYAKELGISNQLAWHTLNNAVSELMQRSIEIFNPYPRSDISKVIFQWVNRAEFNPITQSIELIFSDEICPYLFNMEKFISYKLKAINSLNNRYSIKLYEWLLQELGKSNCNEKTVELELNFFKKMLDLEDSYPVFKEFNRTVLKPILNDLNTNSNIKVQVKSIGRPTSILQFIIKKQRQLDLVSEIVRKEKKMHKSNEQKIDDLRIKKLMIIIDQYNQSKINLSKKEFSLLENMKRHYFDIGNFTTQGKLTEKTIKFFDEVLNKYLPRIPNI